MTSRARSPSGRKKSLDVTAARAVANQMPEAWVEEKPPEPPKVYVPPPLTVEERGRPLPPLPSKGPGPADWSAKPPRNPALRNGDEAARKITPWRYLGSRPG